MRFFFLGRKDLAAEGYERSSEGFFKDGRHSSQFVSRQESFHIKGRRQSCRYKHLLTTSLKVHSLYQSLPYWSCWCLHKEDPPVLTLSLPFSEYNSLHTPSLAVCWQNSFCHLWAFSLSRKRSDGWSLQADPSRARSAEERLTEAQLYILLRFFRRKSSSDKCLLSPTEKQATQEPNFAVISLSSKLSLPLSHTSLRATVGSA